MHKTVLITGNFNVLHPGHIRLFKFAKTCAAKLIVGVFNDKLAGKNVESPQELRQEAVSSITLVDECLLIETSLIDFIEHLKPDIIVKGKEHEHMPNQEIEALSRYGGRLVFSSGEFGETGDIIDERRHTIPLSARKQIEIFLKRHNFSANTLISLVKNFSDKKVCVFGDIIIDEYIDCFPLGMSQEEATLVVRPQEKRQYLGGAGIVASHASRLGASVHFFSVRGQDQAGDFAITELDKYNVSSNISVDTSRPTTLKQRFRSQGKSLLRVSTLSQLAISSALQALIIAEFEKVSSEFDLIVFSDFNYGCLPQAFVEQIICIAKKNGTFIAADSQSSSQIGDIGRYRNVDLIAPTEREARISLKNYDDGLVVLANKLLEKTDAKQILLKLGGDGMIAQVGIGEKSPYTDRLPALNPAPVDVAGAGDSVLITASLALVSGGDLWQASLLGSLAAFIQVGRVGNVPLNPEDLLQVLS